jgi:hypothetical protein
MEKLRGSGLVRKPTDAAALQGLPWPDRRLARPASPRKYPIDIERPCPQGCAARKERFMTPMVDQKPSWSTASFDDATDTSPMELSVLGEHLDACTRTRGRWFALRCGVEQMNVFMASRVVTTLALAALLIGSISTWY